LDTKGGSLLQELAEQERVLISKVEDAKKQASEIIEKAKLDAAKIKEDAFEKANLLALDAAEKLQAESEETRQAILNEVRSKVESIEAKATANREKAVKLVVERVLP